MRWSLTLVFFITLLSSVVRALAPAPLPRERSAESRVANRLVGEYQIEVADYQVIFVLCEGGRYEASLGRPVTRDVVGSWRVYRSGERWELGIGEVNEWGREIGFYLVLDLRPGKPPVLYPYPGQSTLPGLAFCHALGKDCIRRVPDGSLRYYRTGER